MNESQKNVNIKLKKKSPFKIRQMKLCILGILTDEMEEKHKN